MKKFSTLFVLTASLGVPFAAFAATAIPVEQITTTDCPLLKEAVTVNLSGKVYGGYSCDQATLAIKVATCHEGGSRKQTTADCTFTPGADANTPGSWNDDACNDATPTFVTGTNGKAFYASSKGGQVATVDLTAKCDADSIVAVNKLD